MYSKVFSQIFDSSIAEDYVVRHVFMDLLVLANQWGEVDMTLEAIARRTNVPIELVSRAVDKLMLPDPSSRSKENDGKRLNLLDEHRDWGWKIINYRKYRNMLDSDGKREYWREYKRMKRLEEKEKKNGQPISDESKTVPRHRVDKVGKLDMSINSIQAEAEADIKPNTKTTRRSVERGPVMTGEVQKQNQKPSYTRLRYEHGMNELYGHNASLIAENRGLRSIVRSRKHSQHPPMQAVCIATPDDQIPLEEKRTVNAWRKKNNMPPQYPEVSDDETPRG